MDEGHGVLLRQLPDLGFELSCESTPCRRHSRWPSSWPGIHLIMQSVFPGPAQFRRIGRRRNDWEEGRKRVAVGRSRRPWTVELTCRLPGQGILGGSLTELEEVVAGAEKAPSLMAAAERTPPCPHRRRTRRARAAAGAAYRGLRAGARPGQDVLHQTHTAAHPAHRSGKLDGVTAQLMDRALAGSLRRKAGAGCQRRTSCQGCTGQKPGYTST